VELDYLNEGEAALLARNKIMITGDIFKNNQGQANNPDIVKIRVKILDKVGIRPKSDRPHA
jgi:hypothetical protein